MANNWFPTDTEAGFNFMSTIPSASFPAPTQLGEVLEGNSGTVWMLVKAATAINQNDCVGVDGAGNASQMTDTLAGTAGASGFSVGFALGSAFTLGDYGWVAIAARGGGGAVAPMVNTLTGSTANAAVYTTATAGALSTTSGGSHVKIAGLVLTAANSSGLTQATNMIATSPIIF